MPKEIKRTLKDMSDTGIVLNNPNDFLDFSFSYYLPETKDKIDEAVNEFYTRLGKILDEDREAAGKNMEREVPINETIARIRENFRKEIDRRKVLEREAGKLISECRFYDAKMVLNSADNSVAEEIDRELGELQAGLEKKEESMPRKKKKNSNESASAILSVLVEKGLTCGESIQAIDEARTKIMLGRRDSLKRISDTPIEDMLTNGKEILA